MKKALSMVLAVVMVVASLSSVMVFAAEGDLVVTFHNADGADSITTYECAANSTLLAEHYPTREGWYFAGWYTEPEFTNLWYDGTKVTANTDLYAKWVNLPGTVVTEGLNRDTNITYTGGGNYAWRVRNWFMTGWQKTFIDKDQALINSDVTVTVDLNNAYDLYGAVINTIDSKIGGYRFSGSKNGKDWTVMYENTNDGNKVSDFAFPADSRYRFVKIETLSNHGGGWWAHNKIAILGTSNPIYYDVVFESEGAAYHTESNVLENTAVAGPAEIPVHSQGLVFSGWYYDEEATEKWMPEDVLAEATTIYASWCKDPKQVSFDTDGGTEISSYYVEKGHTIQEPEVPVKDKHVFLGWYKDAQYTTLFDFATDTIEEDTTLYARMGYSLNKHGNIKAADPISDFYNQSGRVWKWFNAPDYDEDKNVRGNGQGQNVHVRVRFDQPYILNGIKIRLMSSMYNTPFAIYGSNLPDLSWNDEEWVLLVDVPNGSAVESNFYDITDTTAYKYMKVEAKFDSGWRGFLGIEPFGTASTLAKSEVAIRDVVDSAVTYAIALTEAESTSTVVVALYNGNDMIGVKTVTADSASHTFEGVTGATSAKLFVWDSLTNAKPIAIDEFIIQ